MIIHPSSAILTAEPLRWETMREEPAPGPHPRRKSAADKLESRVPGSESRGTELRFLFVFFSNDSAKCFFFSCGSTKKRRQRCQEREVQPPQEAEEEHFRNLQTLETGLTPEQPRSVYHLPLPPFCLPHKQPSPFSSLLSPPHSPVALATRRLSLFPPPFSLSVTLCSHVMHRQRLIPKYCFLVERRRGHYPLPSI